MTLIKCPECGTEVSDKAVACVKCGYPIAYPTPSGPEPSQGELATTSVKDSGGEGPSSARESVQEITPCTRCRKPAAVEIVGRGRDYSKLLWAAAGVVGLVVFFVWQADTLDSSEVPPGWVVGVIFGLLVWTAYSTWFGLKTQDVVQCTNCGKCHYGAGFIRW